MGYRNFTDTQGRKWEVRDNSRSEWEFSPLGANRERPKIVRAPGYEKDPFELSVEELERLISGPDESGRSTPKKNPFGD